MRFHLLIPLFIFLISNSLTAQSEVYFSDHPTLSPDGKTLIFNYEGDLWKVNADGGTASRITAMEGNEVLPRISPDGKWLAFSGSQFGNQDIFIMPIDGGEIQQLTFHEASDVLSSWSWDSQTLYFTSSRYNRMSAYSIPLNGGTPKRLFGDHYFNNSHKVVAHPNTGELFFNETWESSNFEHRKGYKGAYNPDLKSYNPKTKEYKEWTTWEGKDFETMIDKGGNIYFSSDEHNGEYNLYTFENGKKKRLTKFETSIRRPQISADGSAIVFQKDYQIWKYGVKGKKATKVKIQIPRNPILAKTQDFSVAGNMSAFDVSDDGKKLAFVSRGELFVSDIKGKFVRQLNTDAQGRVVEVYFLKDNKTLIFNQTVGGYLNWFTITADGKGVEKQLTSDKANNRNIAFNSEKSQAVYFSGREEIRMLDLETFASSLLLKEELWGFYNDQPSFSPDDNYVLFTAYRNFERDIFIYDLKEKKQHNLTNTGVSEVAPVWSPDGKYIYFQTNRTEPNYPSGGRNTKIYRMPLRKWDTPYRSDKFDELFAEEEKKEDEKEEIKKDEKEEATEAKKEETADKEGEKEEKKEDEKTPVIIDFDRMMERIQRISPSFGTQSQPYVLQKDEKTTVLYISNHDEGKSSIWKTTIEDFESRKTEKIKGAATGGLNIEEAKGKHYLLFGGNLYTFNVSGSKTEKIKISYTFRRQLQAEFEQMFDETWANMEENFYHESMHDRDWPTLRTRYAAFLPHLNSRGDLRNLLNDMLGELNTSHFGFSSFGKEEQISMSSRSQATGIIFDNENPFVVSKIVRNSAADRVDKNIQKGDVLIKINGESFDASQNRESYFIKPSFDREINLTFKRDTGEHQVKLHPGSYFSVRNQLYNEWIDHNQKQVDEMSNKRVAYVHMKNMGGGELQTFFHDMMSEGYQREGLILDLRYNTGGNVHDEVLRFLSQKPYLNWKYRGGKLTQQSNFGPAAKPIVILINEQSLSDAEMTAAGFKELGLGTIIGTETYRWIIFTSGKGLVDGSFYRLPSWGCYTFDGKNLEKTGVAPDVEVENTFMDRLNGNDPQLKKGIEWVLKDLK